MAPTSKDGSRRENCPLFLEEAVRRREERIDSKVVCVKQLEGKLGASSRGNTDSKSFYGGCCS